MSRTKVAIIGSGNIGTDLLIKILRTSQVLEAAAVIGIDADSDGLARARRLGVATTHEGVEGFLGMAHADEVAIVFDATSAKAHQRHDAILRPRGYQLIETYVDAGLSATNDHRPEFQRMIEAGGVLVDNDQLRRRPLHVRIANWLAYGVVRLAIGLAGYGTKHYRS